MTTDVIISKSTDKSSDVTQTLIGCETLIIKPQGRNLNKKIEERLGTRSLSSLLS